MYMLSYSQLYCNTGVVDWHMEAIVRTGWHMVSHKYRTREKKQLHGTVRSRSTNRIYMRRLTTAAVIYDIRVLSQFSKKKNKIRFNI